MDKSAKQVAHIPPYWLGLVATLLAGAMCTSMVLAGIELTNKMDPEFYAIIYFFFAIISTVCYDLYEDRLVVNVLFIPVRSISWSQISGAVYIPSDWNARKSIRGASVIFSVYPCVPYDQSIGSIRSYRWLHLRKTIRIYIGEDKNRQFVNTIKQCIGIERCHNMPKAD